MHEFVLGLYGFEIAGSKLTRDPTNLGSPCMLSGVAEGVSVVVVGESVVVEGVSVVVVGESVVVVGESVVVEGVSVGVEGESVVVVGVSVGISEVVVGVSPSAESIWSI